MSRPIASLSLDLDNKWSYLKTHGERGWESFPSYLDVVVPRFLDVLDDLGLRMTVFVVGQDAAISHNHSDLARISAAGHEIGNHSFHHEPWLHLYADEQLESELSAAEDAIGEATGQRPRGFRGPGYSLSPSVLASLARRGYQYDCSTLPTFIGPLARAYYFFTARLNREEQHERKKLFGTWTEGMRPLRPYWWQLDGDSAHQTPPGRRLLEIPITTFPLLRTPIHVSYLLFLRQFSAAAAWTYWKLAMTMCRATGLAPSLLLHPLDFLGHDDEPDLGFFPAMSMRAADKVAFTRSILADFARAFRVVPMAEHAAALARSESLSVRRLTIPATADRQRPPGRLPLEPTLTPEVSRQ
jgi:hypothetical protein